MGKRITVVTPAMMVLLRRRLNRSSAKIVP